MHVEPTTCLGVPDPVAFPIAPNVIAREPPLFCDRPRQVGLTRVGPAFADVHVFRQCVCNAHQALRRRHLCPPVNDLVITPPVHAELQQRIALEYRARIGGEARAWRAKWPASKLATIDRARAYDRETPGAVKLTVKRELGGSRPRGIQAYSSLASQALFGPQHTVFQKALFAVLDDFEFYPGVRVSGTSGWDAERLSAWADDVPGGWHFTECDASGFDSTVTRPWREMVATYMEACDPALAAHVRAGIDCVGRIKGDPTNRYRVYGTTKSGHNDTTSGNTLVNATIAALAFGSLGIPARILVIGDDMLAAHPPDGRAAGHYGHCARVCGISPKVATADTIERVAYAGSVWTFARGYHLYQPRLSKLAAQLFLSVNPPSERRRRLYLHGVATGFLSTYGGHPFFERHLRPFVIDNVEWQPGFLHRAGGVLGERRRGADVLAEHFARYCDVRGFTPQRLLSELDTLHRVGMRPVHLPGWEYCLAFDTADAPDRASM